MLLGRHHGDMSADQRHEDTADRWRELPPHIRLEDTVAVQETPPKPQVIADSSRFELDEDIRYPG